MATKIQWTEQTWNPVRGCSRVSPGCDHCYAMGQARRFDHPGGKYEGLTTIRRGKVDWSGRVRLVPEKLSVRRKPTVYFVNSMSDLFHESLTDGEIFAVFNVMRQKPQHIYQVLTKRKRMLEWVQRYNDLSGERDEPALVRGPEQTRRAHPSGRGQIFASYLDTLGEPPPGCAYPTFDWMHGPRWWPPFDLAWHNVWLGVSVEDQQRADERIPYLLETPAAVRFISAEPLLGPIDLQRVAWPGKHAVDVLSGGTWDFPGWGFVNHSDMATLDWVIVGGESGSGARPCNVGWIRRIVEDCRRAEVPCFVKQMGSNPAEHISCMRHWPYAAPSIQDSLGAGMHQLRLRHKKGGDPAEWPADLRVREIPHANREN